MNKKLGFRPRDRQGQIRAGILRRIPVPVSQMVGWRPIWWQKGMIIAAQAMNRFRRFTEPVQTGRTGPTGPHGAKTG